MKKIFTLYIVIFSLSARSQSVIEEIDGICTTYESLIQQSEEEELDFYPAHITIKSTLNKRAIGPVDHTIKLYFDEHEELEEPVEGESGELMTLKSAVLRKVVVLIESGSYAYTDVFYFDENSFLIKFISTELGYECAKRITYFDDHIPIRFIQSPIDSEDCLAEEMIEKIDESNLSKDQMEMAKYRLQVGQEYREMLHSQYEIIKH